MENGELALWDPAKILAGARYVLIPITLKLWNWNEYAFSSADSLILRNTHHTGPIRALDFNPIQTSLLSSGGIGGEVCYQLQQ